MQAETSSKTRSHELYKTAQDLMPGGVNSPVRAFKSIGGDPIFIKKAKGPHIYDEDENQYIDYVGSWGPMILGHADEDIESALLKTIKNGTSFGAPTEIENLMAQEVIKIVPSIEMVRMVNSGTEAVMAALRLARAYTGRKKIIKFAGCYHGHVDSMLVQAGSGLATNSLPASAGVSENSTNDTVIIEFNDKEALKSVFEKYPNDIAAIITEPVIGNAGCILPEDDYLHFLKEISHQHGALLIFDEVMTGFRVALGGAQERYGVTPDITTLGKVIGGGLPVGAYGASKEIMSKVAPLGPMYQAGTLSGNPLAMTAGLTCLRKIQKEGFYEELDKKTKYLVQGLEDVCKEQGFTNAQFAQVGGMFGMFFMKESFNKPVKSYADAQNLDAEFFKKYYLAMLDEAVYLAPSPYEAGFVSQSHSYADLDKTIAAHKKVLSQF